MYNILDYGAVSDGKTNSVVFVQKAIDECVPEGATIGKIKNIVIDKLVATGPYGYIYPIRYTTVIPDEELFNAPVVIASGVVGQPGEKLENISLSNIYLTVPGGIGEAGRDIIVSENPGATPSAGAHGELLPASGIFFRHVKNLSIQNVNVFTIDDDAREEMFFDDVEGLKIY